MKSRILVITAWALASAQLSSWAAATGSGGTSAGGTGPGASGNGGFGVSPDQDNASSTANPGVNPGVNANNNGATIQQGNTRVRTPGVVVTNPSGLVFTNTFAATNLRVGRTNRFGNTNVMAGDTNQVFNTNQVFVTNQVFNTNVVSVTNVGPNDTATTPGDQVILINIRQRIRQKDPGISASWDTIGMAAQSGTVLVSGNTLDLANKQALLAVVSTTPGVVAVVDRLVVNPGASQGGTTGTISRYLNPASDPSLGDSYRFSAPSNRFGQRVFIPPARGTVVATNLSPTGPTNPGTTNVILEGTVGTNNTTVPTNSGGNP